MGMKWVRGWREGVQRGRGWLTGYEYRAVGVGVVLICELAGMSVSIL
jgi:hypothetical protein